MKKISTILLSILLVVLLLVVLLLFVIACDNENEPNTGESNNNYYSVDDIDTDSIKTYKAGEQIELYLNSVTNKHLTDCIDSGALQVSIADQSIVEIQNGVLMPKAQGMTYISCKYGDTIKNYNVIVHNGAEYVTSCSISGGTSNTFSAHVGQTYQINTANTSSCGVSELKIDTYTSYDSVEADELISVNSNGEIRVVGVGNCEIWVHSATNASDKGVRISISSSFAENILASAVTNWVTENLEPTENGVITKSELAEIKTLTFTELLEFNESDWSATLPSLTSVTFDLINGSSFNSTYKITSGKLSYNFVGNENSEYNFSILSDERELLNLSFTNFRLHPGKTTGIDISSVKNAVISYEGVCDISGADAQNNGNGYNGITANNLKLSFQQNAAVTITGGNGSSTSTAKTRIGGNAIRAYGKLELNAISSSYDTVLRIFGGNGGNGYNLGESGGAGNTGLYADSIYMSGIMFCYIYGGKGGNGQNGNIGKAGGDGGNGGIAIVSNNSINVTDVMCSITAGRGGNGGNGGNGANGTSYSGSCSTGFNTYGSCHGTHGGAGGSGGNGGKGGDGGLSISCTKIDLSGLSKFAIQSGNGGNGGTGGIGGSGGKAQHGGDGWISFGYEPGHDGGNGGAGGKGGNGGNGGNFGACVSTDIFKITDGATIEMFDAVMGDGGTGGNGGAGGNGGNGGDSPGRYWASLAIYEVPGGDGGAGGAGGNGGAGGIGNHSGSDGTKGSNGSSGSDG